MRTKTAKALGLTIPQSVLIRADAIIQWSDRPRCGSPRERPLSPARSAAGEYVEKILLTAIVVAVALPLYYYQARIVAWFQGRG